MKALILAGGKGTRLRPITFTSAKQLIPVCNKPILFYGLDAVIECGIKDINVVVGDTENEIKDAVNDYIKSHNLGDVKVTYIKQDEPLGLAHALLVSEPYLKGEEFVMYLGDNLIKGGIKSLIQKFQIEKPNCQIMLSEVRDPERFGVAELKNGKVIKLIEKPRIPPSKYALVGVYIFDDTIFEAAKNIKPSWRNELEITDAIQYLIDAGYDVRPHIITGWWKDTGKLEDLLEANMILLEDIESNIRSKIPDTVKIDGRAIIEEDVKIENSYIRGPVIIGKGTKIINSYIGPFTSIYYNCYIEDSEIEHSIILENAKIIGIKRMDESLIGRDAEIILTDRKPKAYRVMIGDSSRIGL